MSRALLLGGTAAIALVAGTTTAIANAQTGGKTVSYLGLNFTVPADWPVVDISADSRTCVRFDRHAVYLGTPGAHQDCPAHLVGSSEAMLVQPATGTSTSAVDDTASRQITVTTASAEITASYDTDRATVVSVLAGAGLPTAKPTAPKPAAIRAHTSAAATAVPVNATNYTGQGFDACQAPSEQSMAAWHGNSPYNAVGIYLGGPKAACKTQTYLSAQWVSDEYSAGWRFIPIYVGMQALYNEITDPITMGTSEADDAVADAQNLGLPVGSVLYDDMEGYSAQYRGQAQAFEAAWVAELHKDGYFAGIYGSGSSTMADLVRVVGGLATPDVVYDASWNNQVTHQRPDVHPGRGLESAPARTPVRESGERRDVRRREHQHRRRLPGRGRRGRERADGEELLSTGDADAAAGHPVLGRAGQPVDAGAAARAARQRDVRGVERDRGESDVEQLPDGVPGRRADAEHVQRELLARPDDREPGDGAGLRRGGGHLQPRRLGAGAGRPVRLLHRRSAVRSTTRWHRPGCWTPGTGRRWAPVGR